MQSKGKQKTHFPLDVAFFETGLSSCSIYELASGDLWPAQCVDSTIVISSYRFLWAMSVPPPTMSVAAFHFWSPVSCLQVHPPLLPSSNSSWKTTTVPSKWMLCWRVRKDGALERMDWKNPFQDAARTIPTSAAFGRPGRGPQTPRHQRGGKKRQLICL